MSAAARVAGFHNTAVISGKSRDESLYKKQGRFRAPLLWSVLHLLRLRPGAEPK